MFDMGHPWWEYVVRSAIVYFGLLVLVRLSGKRTVGQFTPFDLLVVMLMSEGVSSSLNAGDESVPGGLIIALCLLTFSSLIGFFSSRHARFARWVEGAPVLIGKDGQLFEAVLRRHRVSREEVELALRANDVALSDLKMAVLETDGSLSILKR